MPKKSALRFLCRRSIIWKVKFFNYNYNFFKVNYYILITLGQHISSMQEPAEHSVLFLHAKNYNLLLIHIIRAISYVDNLNVL